MKTWKVRTYQESDDEGIVNLMNLIWGAPHILKL